MVKHRRRSGRVGRELGTAPQFLTTIQAARVSGLSRYVVRRAAQAGFIPGAVKLPLSGRVPGGGGVRDRRIPPAGLIAYLRGVGAAVPPALMALASTRVVLALAARPEFLGALDAAGVPVHAEDDPVRFGFRLAADRPVVVAVGAAVTPADAAALAGVVRALHPGAVLVRFAAGPLGVAGAYDRVFAGGRDWAAAAAWVADRAVSNT